MKVRYDAERYFWVFMAREPSRFIVPKAQGAAICPSTFCPGRFRVARASSYELSTHLKSGERQSCEGRHLNMSVGRNLSSRAGA